MRPTVIRLIAGGALGAAFSVALTLPGSVVFPDEAPIRQLAAPETPTRTVLRAAPLHRPGTAPRPRVVVQRVYVPAAGTAPATSVVRRTVRRSKSSRKPIEREPAPVEQRLTPLAAPPPAPVSEPTKEPKEADQPRKAAKPPKAEKPKKAEKPRKAEQPKRPEKPKRAKKPKNPKKSKDPGSRKNGKSGDGGKKGRDDQGEDEGEHGHGRGNGSRG